MTCTPSKRCGSSISTRRPSASTASLAVSHDTARASAMRATVRCWHTSASSAHRNARRDNLARGSAAAGRVLPPHVTAAGAPVAADRHQQRSSVATRTARAPAGGSRCPAATLRHRTGGTTGRRSTTRQASTARSGSRRCPTTRRPSSSRRQNVVRSGRAKSSVNHVEVFRMGGVGTSILGRPRPSPGIDAPALHPQFGRAGIAWPGAVAGIPLAEMRVAGRGR